MRVRDHIAVSTAGAAVLSPWAGRRAMGLWAGGVLIDIDHYLWFCVRYRRVDPVDAIRAFGQARAPQHAGTRILHHPGALMSVLLLAVRDRRVSPVAVGMSLHVALDALHDARTSQARATALERDNHSCQVCGVRGPRVSTHVWRQPWLLPSYEPENVISLCGPCHEDAHASATVPASWR